MKVAKLLLFPIFVFALAYGTIACSDEYNFVYGSDANTMVRTFAMSADVTVLTNLAYRYFTIDLVDGRIFNPDSFPYGTDITSLVPEITFSSASSAQITVVNKSDGSVVKDFDYLDEDNDTTVIDFTNNVTMKVIAADGVTEQSYRIEVRVHQVQSDSLMWTTVGKGTLPTNIASPTEQKTVSFGGMAYCFTTDGTTYNVGISAAPAESWTVRSFTPYGDTLSLPSIIAAEDTLFALCGTPDSLGNQSLCYSLDGLSWDSLSDVSFSALIGVWEEQLLGIVADSTGYLYATYEAGDYATSSVIDERFPVSGYSGTVARKDTTYGSSQIYFFGGRCADDTFSPYIWAYDGSRWASISDVGLVGGSGASVTPREGALFFAYYQDDYDPASDLYTREPYYYILGGRDTSGIRNDLYYTNTIGGYWEHAAQGEPLYVSSSGYTPRAFASAYVSEESVTEVATASFFTWTSEMPYFYRVTRSGDDPVPYIYVFGGYNSQNNFLNAMSRGVILRFTF
ncbi:MAG: DUF6242 domain-containing protein [Porphyromonadaceae bacterium]|nr:DUF6242 domain-containing protein [Porphyromonadaceae bacterium]